MPNSVSARDGINVAVDCKFILSTNGIENVGVEIRESGIPHCEALQPRRLSPHHPVQVIEPFSTTLGIPICARDAPHIQGVAALTVTTALASSTSSQPDTSSLTLIRITSFTSMTTLTSLKRRFCCWVVPASGVVLSP